MLVIPSTLMKSKEELYIIDIYDSKLNSNIEEVEELKDVINFIKSQKDYRVNTATGFYIILIGFFVSVLSSIIIDKITKVRKCEQET